MKKQGGSGSGELALVEQIRRDQGRRAAARKLGRSVRLGIGDDCAILRVPAGCEVVVTTDFSLERRHFRRNLHSAESVGHRCLARGLSDIAAMGASPMAAFLSLALPGEMLRSSRGRSWVAEFFRGLGALGDRFGVQLAGGDTSESPSGMVLADITVVGSVAAGKALRRSGGRAGDALYCTGRLGGAAAELEAMLQRGRLVRVGRADGDAGAVHPQLFPEPRIGVGQMLLRRGLATACMDLSDGLSSDLARLCAESGVGAEIEEALLPLHRLAAKLGAERGLKVALDGGEDYELLFAARDGVRVPRRLGGVEITRIGRLVQRGRGLPVMMLLRTDGEREELKAGGWEHFAG